ncbi:MAG: hypothetical protein KDD03_02600 [Gelidibacter sp.]|nr:hypothetical protein [Gelidibacter sp.]
MEKIIELTPAFDRRDPNPSKNYGIHGVDLIMVLKGDKGAVNFTLYTNWQLPHVQDELKKKMFQHNHFLFEPMPADIGFHSSTPMYNGQSKMEECKYMNGKDCYYDGSTLMANEVYQILLQEGSEGVWKELERLYNREFDT